MSDPTSKTTKVVIPRFPLSQLLEFATDDAVRLVEAARAVLDLCDKHDWDAIGEDEGRAFLELRNAIGD